MHEPDSGDSGPQYQADPPKTWPAVTQAKGFDQKSASVMANNQDALKKLLRVLHTDLDRYNDPKTGWQTSIQPFMDLANDTSKLGTWDAPTAFQPTISGTSDNLCGSKDSPATNELALHQQFVAAYTAVITGLEQTLKNLGGAEDANTGLSTGVDPTS
jgi:hypothetical protein